MKTIKTFEGLISSKTKEMEDVNMLYFYLKDIVEPVADTLIDLCDIGLKVRVGLHDNKIEIHITKVGRKFTNFFNGGDLIETLLFSIPYLESEYKLKFNDAEISFNDEEYDRTCKFDKFIEFIKNINKMSVLKIKLKYENN